MTGFALVGSATSTCTSDGSSDIGSFDDVEPTCEAISCPNLPTPTNGSPPMCTFSVDFSAVCTFTCNVGFALVGSPTLTCGGDGSSTNGVYDNPPPTCEAITCPFLTPPMNGYSPSCTDGDNYGSTCTFTCMAGFTLVGSATSTCTGDGTSEIGSFDNPAPTCEIVAIDPCSPNPCQNGGTCTTNGSGSSYTCHCDSSHQGILCENNNVCTEEVAFDLIFVNDASGSIGYSDYQKSLQFMVDVTVAYNTSINAGDVRVGVITYSSDAHISIPLGQHSQQYLTNTIMNIAYDDGGTETGEAIDLAHSEFNQNSLYSTSKIMMVLTDGQSGDNPKGPADDARQDGIICMAVGVSNYDENELLDITGHDPSLLFEVNDFDELISFASNITETICAIESDLCFPNPCQNNGTCTSDGNTVTCQCVNGYSGDRCEAKSCKYVQDIAHGTHHYYSNIDGHWPAEICRVQYQCDPGYIMIGYPDILCYNGKWTASPPQCILVTCPPLTPSGHSNMTFVGDSPPNTLHSIVEFTCEEGYQVEEDEDYVLACKEDGTWSSEVPHCVPIKCEGDVNTRSNEREVLLIN